MALFSTTECARKRGSEVYCQPQVHGGRLCLPEKAEWRADSGGLSHGGGIYCDFARLGGTANRSFPMGPYLCRQQLRLTMAVLGTLKRRIVDKLGSRQFGHCGLPIPSEFPSCHHIRYHWVLPTNGKSNIAPGWRYCRKRWRLCSLHVLLGSLWRRSVAAESELLSRR